MRPEPWVKKPQAITELRPKTSPGNEDREFGICSYLL